MCIADSAVYGFLLQGVKYGFAAVDVYKDSLLVIEAIDIYNIFDLKMSILEDWPNLLGLLSGLCNDTIASR
ncbi:hypothetical protein Plhal710r2_c015g0066901 [Plasmopara halstedii]